MEVKDRIYEKLVLTMLAQSAGVGKVRFYLVGLVPAEIIWEDGKREQIELAGRIPIEPFSEGKALLGQRVLRKDFEAKLKGEHLTALVAAVKEGFDKVQEAKQLGGKKFGMLALV